MENLNNVEIGYHVGDIQREYFKARHEENLNEMLQSKLGEHASITTDVKGSEEGGYLTLSFGKYDVREELLNFADKVAGKMELSIKNIEDTLNYCIKYAGLNADIEWSEEPKLCEVKLEYSSKDYKKMSTESEGEKYRYEVIDALKEELENFVNETINKANKEFCESWVYVYSANEEF